MRILMAGVSGFLGTRLVERLRGAGHDVTRLVRRPARSADEAPWRPSAGQLDPALLTAADAVINLAGAGVGDKRWTPRYQAEIRASRVDGTSTIAQAIAHLPAADRPRTMLQASAVGWYGDTGDQKVTEESPAGNGFLADVCRVWEAAARPAEDAGTRVVLMRTGLPLDQHGGLLKPQMLPFRLGVGARLGGGRQWLPWISLEDWLRAVEFLLDKDGVAGPGNQDNDGVAGPGNQDNDGVAGPGNRDKDGVAGPGNRDDDGVAGPVNVVGPEPVTNAEFTATFARVLNRPAVLMIPGLALEIALGGFGGEALKSQRVMPRVLERAGFTWTHATLESALRAAVRSQPREAA